MKPSLLVLAAVGAAALTACTTLENRRDMYFPQTVQGPYTRMVRDGIPKPATTTIVSVEAQTAPISGK